MTADTYYANDYRGNLRNQGPRQVAMGRGPFDPRAVVSYTIFVKASTDGQAPDHTPMEVC